MHIKLQLGSEPTMSEELPLEPICLVLKHLENNWTSEVKGEMRISIMYNA
jgi:hypothetical protein